MHSSPSMATTETTTCPQCEAVLPVHTDYAIWCPKCEWNLDPAEPSPQRRLFGSFYDGIGRKASRALFNQMLATAVPRARMTFSKVLALSIAVMVHILTLAFFVLGGVLIIRGWPHFFLVLGGMACLGIGWLLRPQPTEIPCDILPREAFPMLYSLVDDVADALDVSPPYGIVLNESFNAAFGHVGWQRRPILYLGLPLFSTLNEQEKVALIGHELAHGINGDLTRGFVVGTAINSLERLYTLMRPDDDWDSQTGLSSTLLLPFNIMLLGFARLPWLMAYALAHLLWRDGQRAEYLADYLASTVSDTCAMRSMLDTLHLDRTFQVAVQTCALQPQGRRFFPEFSQRVERIPEHERERIRRVERMEQSRLDRTHPPTTYRIAFLEAHSLVPSKAAAACVDFAQLEREIATEETRIEKVLIDQYRRHLYY